MKRTSELYLHVPAIVGFTRCYLSKEGSATVTGWSETGTGLRQKRGRRQGKKKKKKKEIEGRKVLCGAVTCLGLVTSGVWAGPVAKWKNLCMHLFQKRIRLPPFCCSSLTCCTLLKTVLAPLSLCPHSLTRSLASLALDSISPSTRLSDFFFFFFCDVFPLLPRADSGRSSGHTHTHRVRESRTIGPETHLSDGGDPNKRSVLPVLVPFEGPVQSI